MKQILFVLVFLFGGTYVLAQAVDEIEVPQLQAPVLSNREVSSLLKAQALSAPVDPNREVVQRLDTIISLLVKLNAK